MTGDVTSRQIVPKSPACPEGLFLMDGIEGLRSLPKHSVDMLLTDPPYGTTRNFWDVPLPLPELLARGSIGNTGAMFLMLAVMLPAFLLAMYEKDGLPAEKVLKNIIRARFLRPGVRPYQTQNIYAPFAGRGAVRKEDAIAKGKSNQRKKNRKG